MDTVSEREHHTEPGTAEALMRSRFEAFRRGDRAWLLRTWHASTRPASLELDDNPAWRGLQIVDTVAGAAGDTHGVVEFRATYRLPGGGVGVQHERSRFIRDEDPAGSAARWFYLDGETRETRDTA